MENHRASCLKLEAVSPQASKCSILSLTMAPGCATKFDPWGQRGWRGEVYFASVTAAPESLARFGPPGSGSGTPSPGLDLAGSSLIQPVASRGWASVAGGWAGALPEGAGAPYIFRLGAGAGAPLPALPLEITGNNNA
jgi:hypothetical protein